MHTYRIDQLAMLGVMLGESQRGAATINAMPAITAKLVRHTMDQLSDAVREQAGFDLTLHFGRELESMRELADSMIGKVRGETERCLQETLDNAEKLGLPDRWVVRVRRVLKSVQDSDAHTLEIRLHDLIEDLGEELREPRFLYIPAAKRHLFDQQDFPFGDKVLGAFPDSERDLRASARCMALDEWTAAVFHLMRALESPLQLLAARLSVTFPGPTELENWKNIIDKIESEIDRRVGAGEQQKKSHGRNDLLKLYGELNIQLRHFKNAWRNSVAHGREHYDEREAMFVFDSVKRFMQELADALSSPSPVF